MKYGFIGCGNMGGAIAKALSRATKEIMVSDRSGIYQGCKDLNEYLQQVSRKQQKNNNLKIKE